VTPGAASKRPCVRGSSAGGGVGIRRSRILARHCAPLLVAGRLLPGEPECGYGQHERSDHERQP
jgi:hypothetical protein